MVSEVTRETIERFIDSIEDEDRKLKLRQLQFRIDRELRPYKDPVAKMNKMIEIFWEGVKEFQNTIGRIK